MSEELKVTLFGAPRLTLGEQELTGVLTGKAWALLVYLLVTTVEGRPPHRRDVLADLLWSELANQQARNNLRYLLPELRKVVGDYLLITPQTIGFNREKAYWLDVEVLQSALTAPAHMVSTAGLQAALDLYQAEFLAGFSVRNAPVFEAWLRQQRARWHDGVTQGLYTLAVRYQQAGNLPAGLATTQRLLQWEPWHEVAHRLAMWLLAASGQRSAALAQYVLCRQTLADELGVEPEPATLALYAQIRNRTLPPLPNGPSGRVQSEQNITVPETPPQSAGAGEQTAITRPLLHNLPSQLTPFIGREAEIAELCITLLNPAHRLLTLVGEGGIGKTRLALALAEAVKEHFADGAWFVALADIAPDGNVQEHIVAAMGEALGIRFVGSEHLTKQLFARLREQQLLLIMDNFEHLVEERGFALDLLRTAPGVKILVTSRQRLDFQAEIVWRLDGLAVPSAEASRPLREDDFRQVASVALFVERAHRVWPTFLLDATNWRAVTQICQLLEGLPLGIELAAAQLRQYTCAEIAEALQSSYDLLATSLRDVPPRHRTMYAVLAYSWRLLTAEEQHVLAACSLFRGGFNREAAVALAQATPALLNSLEDKSLLRLDSSRRFTMHKLVQQFAAEQHSTQADENALLHRYSAYFLDLLASQAELLKFDGSVQALLQRELDNIRQAWQWVTAQGNTALLEKGLTGLIELFRRVGLLQELETMLSRATAAVRG